MFHWRIGSVFFCIIDLRVSDLSPQDLMYEETSPIIDFYPRNFELDMNGKKQDWEAVVKIPFIDQKRLLKAMAGKLSKIL